MERSPPPIRPYKNHSKAGATSPNPLLFEAISQLEAYLPPKRVDFLRENGVTSSQKPAADLGGSSLPHVTLTYAQSMDAQISLQPGTQTILSGPETKAMTHYLRSRHDAIMVGIGTAKADNPGLCTRYSEDGVNVVGLEKQPRPFVLDPRGRWRLEDTPKLFGLAESGEGRAPWWITRLGEENLNAGLFEKIHDVGGGVIDVGEYGGKDAGVDWGTVLRRMAENGITSVMIEGGGAVIKDLLRKKNQKYISSVIVTIAPTYLGEGGVGVAPKRSTEAENEVHLEDVKWVPLGQDVVMAGFIKYS